MNNWNKEEIKALFDLVENFKTQNKTRIDAFTLHAQKYNRKPLSVRNFYYKQVDQFLQDKALKQQMDINLQKHQKNNYAKFSPNQVDKLLNHIKLQKKQGKSVRGACLEMSHGDIKTLTRLQNKYSAVRRKSNQKLEQANIINFPQQQKTPQQKLTDAEIQSLFLGLVNLIKKSAQVTAEQNQTAEKQKLSLVITNTTALMQQKNQKIEMLLKENKKLSANVVSLKQKLEQLRSNFVEKINV